MPARCPLHHEHPVVVPQVMHPTCQFQDVSHIDATLPGLLSVRQVLCEPLDNGIDVREAALPDRSGM